MLGNLAQAIWVELLKARRSKMPLFTTLGFAMVPLAGGFFMIVLKDPEMAKRMGLISAKAQLTMGASDWPTYLSFLSMAVGAGGIILFGLIASWVFGREYSDHTLKDILALPTSRSVIVMGKFIVIGLWSLIMTVLIFLITLGVGLALDLPPASPVLFWQTGLTISLAAGMIIGLTTTIALAASIWHGYLPAVGILFLLMGLGQLMNIAGWGEYFPWVVPALVAQGDPLGIASYLIVGITTLAGLTGTLLWWEMADQVH